jgi:hypothetical protein
MLNQIMIRGIQDLTDARYFAAMGVDWLGVPVSADPKSFATWHALREWVEGPRFAVEFESYDEAVFAKTMIDLNPNGMIIDAQQQFPPYETMHQFIHTQHLPNMEPDDMHTPIVHMPAHEVAWLAHGSNVNHIMIETQWTPAIIKQTLEQGYTGGFCFNTVAPLTTGIRDYADMDEMLEMLT